MTETERNEMESYVKKNLASQRSSCKNYLPTSRYYHGFTRTTMSTAKEKVGLIFSLLLSIGEEKCENIATSMFCRQQKKYNKILYSDSNDCVIRGDSSFFKNNNKQKRMERSKIQVNVLISLLHRYGFHNVLNENFDELQVEFLLSEVWSLSSTFQKVSCKQISTNQMEFIKMRTNHFYLELRKDQDEKEKNKHIKELKEVFESVSHQSPTSIQKHYLLSNITSTSGPTSAILSNIKNFKNLLALALCYRSTLHHWELLQESEKQLDVLASAITSFLSQFHQIIYRGDDTVDTATPKMHSHKSPIYNIKKYGTPMGWDASLGERGLKTWAKLVSKTAQKQSNEIFLSQTAERVSERLLLISSIMYDGPRNDHPDNTNPTSYKNPTSSKKIWTRKEPNYIYNTKDDRTMKVTNKGERNLMEENPYNKQILQALKEWEGNDAEISIWNEISYFEYGEKQYLRAAPSFDKFGDYYDWATIQYDKDINQEDPAKLLLFYRSNNNIPSALILPCKWHKRTDKEYDTLISKRFQVQFHTNNYPQIRTIPIEKIKYCVFGMEHQQYEGPLPPPSKTTSEKNKFKVDVVLPQREWIYQFMNYGESELKSSN